MATKTVIKTGTVALPIKADNTRAMDVHPWLIKPIIWACIVCICSITAVALWKIVTGNDTPAYALVTACLLGDFVVLGVFFGKDGKAGALSMTK